jgi:DNA-binding response OmpR family regulator
MGGSGSLEGLKVFVVEDEMLVSMLVEDMLTDLGCQVIGPAASLGDAIPMAETADIDAALLDLNLAGKSVHPVAGILQNRKVPFVFASGYGDPGGDGPFQGVPMLQKPYRMGDLEKALRSLLE